MMGGWVICVFCSSRLSLVRIVYTPSELAQMRYFLSMSWQIRWRARPIFVLGFLDLSTHVLSESKWALWLPDVKYFGILLS